ncbi:MAG: hypothetical protein JWP06_415 [Candidatus Saccharibacteria bacterium]|nr:hypothetical protein [Candidatus Saccharibacteria bacterium]
MSIEIPAQPRPTDLDTEMLIQLRRDLHKELGDLSVLLNDVTTRYQACLATMTHANETLRSRGVDIWALAQELQQEVHPDSAIAGYGQYDRAEY